MPTVHRKSPSHKRRSSPQPRSSETYQGQKISTIRDAVSGDPGFNGTEGQQAIVRLEDGEQITVMYSELDD